MKMNKKPLLYKNQHESSTDENHSSVCWVSKETLPRFKTLTSPLTQFLQQTNDQPHALVYLHI